MSPVDKLEALRGRLSPALDLAAAEEIDFELTLEPAGVRRLFAMGPSARHAQEPPLPGEPVTARVSVTVAAFIRG